MVIGTDPAWLRALQDQGFEPYIATSKIVAPHLHIAPFGRDIPMHFMEDAEESEFLEAYLFLETYLLSNSLSFESPGLKMPHWVLIDCVLMQTAVVGFTAPVEMLPDYLMQHYQNDPAIDLGKLKRLPVSGQICASNMGNRSMTGISLFSLGRSLKHHPEGLGFHTKMLALEVYRAREYDFYHGIAQYNNPALKIHGNFSSRMEIYQPTVQLHPGKDMTFIYKMKPDYDPYDFKPPVAKGEPTFWLDAKDSAKKKEMRAGIKQGKRYIMQPPFSLMRDGHLSLPILEE